MRGLKVFTRRDCRTKHYGPLESISPMVEVDLDNGIVLPNRYREEFNGFLGYYRKRIGDRVQRWVLGPCEFFVQVDGSFVQTDEGIGFADYSIKPHSIESTVDSHRAYVCAVKDAHDEFLAEFSRANKLKISPTEIQDLCDVAWAVFKYDKFMLEENRFNLDIVGVLK
jgi:hypothetical protein